MGFEAFAALCLALLVCGCAQVQPGPGPAGVVSMPSGFEKVSFVTKDGFKIVGMLGGRGGNAVLLMHQFQLDKYSFAGFAGKLAGAGFTVLAIDLRGHGESVDQNGHERTFRSFSGQDFRDMEMDAEAAKAFLVQRGFRLVAVVGSSIGANTALNFAADDGTVRKVVLLSPGMEFKGITVEGAARRLDANVLLVAGRDDAYSFSTCQTLNGLIRGSEFLQLGNAGHGTYMFSGTGLEERLVQWLGR